MAIKIKFKDVEFGVGDKIKVVQEVKEGDKKRLQPFEGTVIKIKGEGDNKSFTVRRIGIQNVGIERIYPLTAPSIKEVSIIKTGVKGARHSKLYYIRNKSKKEIENIYLRASRRK